MTCRQSAGRLDPKNGTSSGEEGAKEREKGRSRTLNNFKLETIKTKQNALYPVTGYCYGVVLYKASHATATIF
jgi:hypothetical protein